MKRLLVALLMLLPASLCLGQAVQTRDLGPVVTLINQVAGTVNSVDQVNPYSFALKCVVSITGAGGTPTLVVTIQGKDGASGNYFTLLASASLNSVGTTVLTVGPGLTATTNVIAVDYLPGLWRVGAVVGGTNPSVSATVGCSAIG